ncbi:MAG: hypothetical protein HRT60_07215 [Dinoroseobacter sp.]|nr:hypothetical protein [Dinoroseobacter sp.]
MKTFELGPLGQVFGQWGECADVRLPCCLVSRNARFSRECRTREDLCKTLQLHADAEGVSIRDVGELVSWVLGDDIPPKPIRRNVGHVAVDSTWFLY